MKEKMYVGKSLAEIEELAITELGVSKDDLYFDVISPVGTKDEEMEIFNYIHYYQKIGYKVFINTEIDKIKKIDSTNNYKIIIYCGYWRFKFN